MAITTRHKLLTNSRTADVEAIEAAIGRFSPGRLLSNNCDIVFFELTGDEHLHVNVTHRYATRSATGWAGPGRLPDGFVHNRKFSDMEPKQLIRHIRDMVFAERA